ncbi:hypothetical protein Tco_1140316 [Tanacetum coccineum]
MTNKIDTVLKAIIDRIAGALPSDMVKNQKMSTFPVLSARSYPTIDPQCSSYPSTSINSIKAHSKEANISQVESLEIVWLHNRGNLILSWTEWLKSSLMTACLDNG